MKRLLAAFVAISALLAAGNAGAADLSLAPLYKAPPAPAPAYDWSGFYLGINGGGGWGHSYWSGQGSGFGLSGGQAGGTLGYNWQVGKVVLGAEGDVDWMRLTGTDGSTLCPGCNTTGTWLSTVRGRLGYSFDRVMPYVTGGLAVGDINAAAPGLTGASNTNAGWTVGGGVEVALPGNWSAKAEYLHVDLGAFNCGANCGVAPTDNVSMRDNIFRAGVNYKFGWAK
jgi:outer membrane immunogenic protein